jgi:protein SCO1
MRKYWALLLLTWLTACGNNQHSGSFIGTDITGAHFEEAPALTTQNGEKKRISDYKNKVVVLFFGYTHCPDVCPTTMTDLKKTMKLLKSKANKVQVLFITVDPERDTKDVLAKFIPYFDKRFIGLTGSKIEIDSTMAAYKVFASKVKEPGSKDYTVDHSAGLYILDTAGEPRVYVNYGQKAEDIAHDINELL